MIRLTLGSFRTSLKQITNISVPVNTHWWKQHQRNAYHKFYWGCRCPQVTKSCTSPLSFFLWLDGINSRFKSCLDNKLKEAEAVTQRCSVKKVFLEISQNSQENTCIRVSFLIKLLALGLPLYWKRDSGTGVFLWILWIFWEHLFFFLSFFFL